MRITAPQGSSLYEEQMEEIERQAAGQPGPMAMANIAAPMPQMQQPAIVPPTQQDPSLGSQAKEMVVDKAIGAGMDKVMDTAAGAALGKMGAAFGPMGMIAGEVAGQFLPQLLKRGLGFNDGGHVGPLGVKYYNTGTPGLFGDAYADPGKAASSSVSAAYQGAPMQNAVTELGKIERPTVGPNTGGGGFGGFLSGLFNSPVFAPLSNLVSGVGQWAGEAFPDAGSSAAAKAIAADANKGKSPIGADSWTWSIGNRNFTTTTPAKAHETGKIADWQYVETLKNTGGSPYKGFKGALNAALPGAVGATPVYDKKTNKTNWFHKPTPQQLHPENYKSDGGRIGPLRSGRPYSGVFSKPVTPIPIMESVKAHLEKPAVGIQNIIDNAPKARVVAPNALSIAPKFMGPLGTLAAVLEPTQAAVATRDPVNVVPMGLEAEMLKRQAAINEAKNRAAQDMIDSNQTSNEIQHDTRIGPLNYDYSYDKNLWDNVVERGKQGLENIGRWAMPKVIDKAGGLVDILGPLAEIPPSRSPNYMAPRIGGPLAEIPPSRSPNPRQGYESGQDKRQMYSFPRVYET
tara:strand:+ start:3482 stop:5197 length:1716 start_codon:yes stop_codon:yes gene_type:complete